MDYLHLCRTITVHFLGCFFSLAFHSNHWSYSKWAYSNPYMVIPQRCRSSVLKAPLTFYTVRLKFSSDAENINSVSASACQQSVWILPQCLHLRKERISEFDLLVFYGPFLRRILVYLRHLRTLDSQCADATRIPVCVDNVPSQTWVHIFNKGD